ncbi:hypothetical protein BJV77DRAFT_202647 [Russula vinacea]|nr:hypothetical protein BJV77DRAFT_202647 [Russula vinacea]
MSQTKGRYSGFLSSSIHHSYRTFWCSRPTPVCPPVTHRLESLERWSEAWRQPGAYLRSPSRILTDPSKSNTDFLLYDDYLVAIDFSGRNGYRHVAGYAWLDFREPGDAGRTYILRRNWCPSLSHSTLISRICWPSLWVAENLPHFNYDYGVP